MGQKSHSIKLDALGEINEIVRDYRACRFWDHSISINHFVSTCDEIDEDELALETEFDRIINNE